MTSSIPVRPIRTLLVANRGEIAVRVMATARAMGISTVAVYSDPDAGAPHVRAADRAVRLPGATPGDTYLAQRSIIAAARSTGADAIHPGYGFLSENASFARACAEAGIVFVGPSPEAIDAMGSKIAAKALISKAGVPVLPGRTVGPDDDVVALGHEVGFPIMVKAAFGGGGRGMRVVGSPDELPDAVASARREAAAAFGDGTVFLERFVVSPRHIEVQIFGDHHGNVVHLFERECSIQRRHQKIIEEAPSPAVGAELRDALGAAATTAARALGYVGAGTVEFVMAPDGTFAFLEVNTRLQVEHPVTELVTGLDLVRLQLTIAEGRPIPDEVRSAGIAGHAIEARLYAEDVAGGYLPVSGPLDRLRITSPGVRVDTGYEDGSTVSTFYDAMLAKVIAWAPTRDEAARKLAAALRSAEIHGVPTNRDLLVAILDHTEFRDGATDTGFLERHGHGALVGNHGRGERAVRAAAAALATSARRRTTARVAGSIPAGWRNVRTAPQTLRYDDEHGTVTVGYSVSRTGTTIEVDGVVLEDLRIVAVTPEAVTIECDGVVARFGVHFAPDATYVDGPAGSSRFVPVDRFPVPEPQLPPGSLRAPLPGSVTKVLRAEGDVVAAGEAIVVLEAMKMEHRIVAPTAGTVTSIGVVVGDQVETGAVLAVVEPHPEDHSGEDHPHDGS